MVARLLVGATTLLVLVCLHSARANLNLFIGPDEVQKLLGLLSELYYVREGVVNAYAMQFTVLVPAQIRELHFVWQNLGQAPMPYSVGFSVSNTEALGPPQLNITRRGVVPQTPKVFRVLLPCTGHVTAEVELTLQMNFTISVNNVTVLNFKRRKICVREDSAPRNDSVTTGIASASSEKIYAIVGSLCGVVLLAAVGAGIYCAQTNKARRNVVAMQDPRSQEFCNRAHTFLRVETLNNASSSGSYSSIRRFVPGQTANGLRSSELTDRMSEISVDKKRIELKETLQEGTFGRIYHGLLATDDDATRLGGQVVVKTVTDQASQTQVGLLVAEGMMMFGLEHPNIQTVLAVSLEDKQQPYIIYPPAAHGNLKRFLQKCKFSPEGHSHVLLTQELVDMAVQIAQGMIFLHKKRIVHRDLATRNCVMDRWLHVKITDNALARDLFPNDYHCLGDNENRPIKWLALECLVTKHFCPASDVWAFGVTFWELMTLGQQPYTEIDPFEMAAYLKDGYRLAQPVNCPDELFTLMGYCWVVNPEDRPSFVQLSSYLEDFYTALGRYV